jgi:hypothetical protein
MLIQQFVRFDVERGRIRVPDDLIDTDRPSNIGPAGSDPVEVDEKDRPTGGRRRVDLPVEGDREARLKIEAVERVDDLDILTV